MTARERLMTTLPTRLLDKHGDSYDDDDRVYNAAADLIDELRRHLNTLHEHIDELRENRP